MASLATHDEAEVLEKEKTMMMVMAMMYLPPPGKGLQGPSACAQSVRIPASSLQQPPVPSPPGCSRHAHRIALSGCGVRLASGML